MAKRVTRDEAAASFDSAPEVGGGTAAAPISQGSSARPGVSRARRDAGKGDGASQSPPSSPPSGGGEDEGLYDGCPVTALGVEGGAYYYLDALRQLRSVTRHDQEAITSLWAGDDAALRAHWPRFGKPKADGTALVTGFDAVAVRADLMRACSQRGVWSAANRVRGVGAWVSEDGDPRPVLHCGDAVLHGDLWRAPGFRGEHVYPADTRQPRPHPDPVEPIEGPGWELLRTVETWRLAGGATDARLVIGWIGCAMFAGALDWRPMLWITAPANSGKSTLNRLLIAVLGGDAAVVQSTDPSEAGIRQHLKLSARPVLLDEIESEADNKRVRDIIKLARQAASGGVVLRGGADHQGQEFKARSAFMFSSILIPSLLDQDISRLAVIDLQPFDGRAVAPRIDARHWRDVGSRLRRLIRDAWPRWTDTLDAYRSALAAAGHSSRGCDQFGTLLAMSDVMLHPGLPDTDTIDESVSDVTAERVAQRFGTAADWERCLGYLVGQQLQRRWKDRQMTVGEMIAAAADLTWGEPCSAAEANAELARVGLRVIGAKERASLAVANAHDGLRRLFEDTRWRTERGQTGVWAQSLRRAPGASPSDNTLSFARVTSRAWLLPVRLAISTESGPAPAPAPEEAEGWREIRA